MAIKALKIPGILLVLLSFCQVIHSQVILVPEVQAGGVVMKQQLWSAVINNLSGSTKNGILYVSVTDKITSQVLMEASSSLILLPAGAKRVSYNEVAPLNYAVSTIGFSTERQLNQPLPVGEYLVCYRLFDAEGKREMLATECVKIIAEPLSPPLLIQPENKTVVMEPRPVMTWTPPAPVYLFNALSYDIIVSPLYDKQSPEEALQRNIPVMTTSSLQNSILYPSSYTNLVAGKTYAWQVVAKDGGRQSGKSEVWTFTVMPDSITSIIENASYVKLSKENTEVTVMHQGILKAEYFNFLSDSTVQVVVQRKVRGNARSNQSTRFEMPVKKGQNFLKYNLNGKMRLDEDEIYEVRLINGNKEEWVMKFIPKNYL